MSKRIALQLYSVRDEIGKNGQDYESIVRKIAGYGYSGVETAGFPGTTPQKAAKLFKELALTVSSAHVGLPLGKNKQEILDTIEQLGKPTLVCTQIRPDDVKTIDSIKKLCDLLNEGYEVAKINGIAYAIHNHWWEFSEINGKLVHDIMVELLSPGVSFELDTYWIKVAGHDPVRFIKNLGKRVPLLHIKDGPVNREEPMTAVGDGKMDIRSILSVENESAWNVVELDRCGTDMLEAIRRSYAYLSGL